MSKKHIRILYKLSMWFDEDTKPVNCGVYETKVLDYTGLLDGWSRWMGEKWSDTCNTKEQAAISEGVSGLQNKQWRGIVK